MKLNEYNFRKKEDKDVFKALMRCLKETNNLYKVSSVKESNIKKGFEEVIRKCYVSRDTHSGENFQTNICFWLDDCGAKNINQLTRFIYIALLINYLNIKISYLGERYINIYNELISKTSYNLSNRYNYVCSYHTKIKNAFMKIGFSEDESETKTNAIELLEVAFKEEIPF